MIVLFTDFGVLGPYLGQVKAVLHQEAPGVPVVDLFADAPAFDPQASAYLLAAFITPFPAGSVFLCVVDPGVGSARPGIIIKANERWFVGPDNGLFNIVAKRSRAIQWWDITWRPPWLSASFHGRDLFAPIASRLARGEPPPGILQDVSGRIFDWPDDLARIVYLDHYGNAMTGLRASSLSLHVMLDVRGHRLSYARTFSDVAAGQAFWYENANGLVELAINRGSAATELGLQIGDAVMILS